MMMKKIAMVFPGQGSQYVGMGKKLYDEFQSAREVFEEANDGLGFDLKKLCFEGSLEELTKTENTQPAILTCSVAAFKVYRQEIGVLPMYSAGHSLGEFSALCCAGSIGFSDAVRIVRQRGIFMQAAVEVGIGAMAAIEGLDKDVIIEKCFQNSTNENLAVAANFNSPQQIVISGHAEAVRLVSENLVNLGAKVTPLKVSAPFHSPLMETAAGKFAVELQKYSFSEGKWPVISNVTALPYDKHNSIAELLTRQITSPVRWDETMAFLTQQGVNLVIDIGPRMVLKNLTKKNNSLLDAYSYDIESDVKSLHEVLSPTKEEVSDRASKLKLIGRCMGVAVCTRNSNWDNIAYNKGVVEPYRKIQQMYEELEKDGREITIEEMQAALDMLKSVFVTKGTPREEQQERFLQVFTETGTQHYFKDFVF